jgi:diguanylate cyclase
MTGWVIPQIMLLLCGSLLAAGSMTGGYFLAVHLFRRSSAELARAAQLHKTMHRLFEWTHGMSIEMAEYQEVVEGVVREMDDDPDRTGQEKSGVVGRLVDANRKLRERLDSAESSLRHQSDELAAVVTQAHTDSLTGLPNRRSFDTELERRLAEFRRKRTPLTLLLLDIDLFKRFNDDHGHLVGDRVLRFVGETLAQTIHTTDVVTRFGGEEFAVIMPDTQGDDARLATERIRIAIETKEMMIDRKMLKVTVSCGLTQAQEGDIATKIIDRSDVALYRAKEAGRNRAYWHDGFVAHPIGEVDQLDDEDGDFNDICDALRQRLIDVSGNQPLK